MTSAEMNRLRWHCRRGRLENDLVLGRFLDAHGEGLQGERLAAFKVLLDCNDDDLWNLVSGRSQSPDPALGEVLQLLRCC